MGDWWRPSEGAAGSLASSLTQVGDPGHLSSLPHFGFPPGGWLVSVEWELGGVGVVGGPKPVPGAASSRVYLVALIPAFLGLEACSLGLGVLGGRQGLAQEGGVPGSW